MIDRVTAFYVRHEKGLLSFGLLASLVMLAGTIYADNEVGILIFLASTAFYARLLRQPAASALDPPTQVNIEVTTTAGLPKSGVVTLEMEDGAKRMVRYARKTPDTLIDCRFVDGDER